MMTSSSLCRRLTRISPPVAEVLATDPFVRFDREPGGPWTLHDLSSGALYRSGWDNNPSQPCDYAYFGRLARPDGNGSLIVFTGIHPPGSLGVVELLVTQLAELYDQLKDGRFSAVVRTDYDPDTHEPRKVDLVTPLYRHQSG